MHYQAKVESRPWLTSTPLVFGARMPSAPSPSIPRGPPCSADLQCHDMKLVVKAVIHTSRSLAPGLDSLLLIRSSDLTYSISSTTNLPNKGQACSTAAEERYLRDNTARINPLLIATRSAEMESQTEVDPDEPQNPAADCRTQASLRILNAVLRFSQDEESNAMDYGDAAEQLARRKRLGRAGR
ncbi:hypothetical protein BDW69DRAFT_141790 [Aspergillus filifer]